MPKRRMSFALVVVSVFPEALLKRSVTLFVFVLLTLESSMPEEAAPLIS